MAKIGCLKPFRGSYSSLSNIVLEDGEIAFETANKRIYMGNGVDTISSLSPFINNGNKLETPRIHISSSDYLLTNNTWYTVPSDGYIQLSFSAVSTEQQADVIIRSASTSTIQIEFGVVTTAGKTASYYNDCIFVKKGMLVTNKIVSTSEAYVFFFQLT